MGEILLVEDNGNVVKRIVQYIRKISTELKVNSFCEAGEALRYAKVCTVQDIVRPGETGSSQRLCAW